MATRREQFKAVQSEGLELFARKNKDYGDAFADYGVVGVLVRMGDKIRRLQSISSNGVTLVKNESFRDTLIDLHNYAAMAVLLLDANENMETTTEEEDDGSEDENVIVNEDGCRATQVWDVPSSSVHGTRYEVVRYEDGSLSCTCKGFEYHSWCRHCIQKKGENVKAGLKPSCNKRPRTEESGTHKWFVESSTDPSKQYEVTRDSSGVVTCTCEGFKHRHNCKHSEQYKK